MNVLIVDDSTAMRMMVMKTMRDAGHGNHDFIQAKDGADALEKIEGERVNLVLCDWNMPNMNGMELLSKLRADGNEVTFGFITTESTGKAVEEAKEAGAQFIITKPFTAHSFAAALDPIL